MKISTENSSTMVSSSSSSSSPTTTTRLPTARILAEKRIQKINQKKAMSSLDNLPQEEMQQLLAKLKDLVPSIPKNRKLSKLEIIQNVIDYILDLEMALECPTKDSSTVTTMALPSSTSPTSNPLGLQQCNHTSHSHHQHYHQVVVSGSSSS